MAIQLEQQLRALLLKELVANLGLVLLEVSRASWYLPASSIIIFL